MHEVDPKRETSRVSSEPQRGQRTESGSRMGPSTAARLSRFGIRVDLTPGEHRAEAVLDELEATGDLTGTRILLPRADLARDVLADELRDAGADVVDVIAG